MFGKFQVWYNLDGIANVISLNTMTEHYWVMYDGDDKGGVFTVHTKNGKAKFICHPWGLHYLDMSKANQAELKEKYGVLSNRLRG